METTVISVRVPVAIHQQLAALSEMHVRSLNQECKLAFALWATVTDRAYLETDHADLRFGAELAQEKAEGDEQVARLISLAMPPAPRPSISMN